jgi:membrane protein
LTKRDPVRRAGAIVKRTLVSFYDDQMTHHAAALTYYALMSLFPAVLLALSLLGLLGQYPDTYNGIIRYLEEVAPASVVDPLDRSLRDALQSKGTAATALVISVAVALYGTTGALEASRRALNVVFEVEGGRSFVRRKAVDVASTFVLMALVLASLLLAFVGGRFAEDLLGFIGLGSTAARTWNLARWPGAVAVAMLVFAFIYYVTPDVKQRSFRWVTPGAAVGVLLWLLASFGLSTYVSKVADVGAVYGTFAGAILLVAWLWLTNVALLLGAELNAEIERERELREGVTPRETLNRPARSG